MMSSVIGSESRPIQFIREKVHCVEEKFKNLSFFPCISGISGGTEALLGLVSLVSAVSMLVFYKARMYTPVAAIKKAIWAKSEGESQAVELVRDSAKVIAMGLLKAVPVIGNASAYWIYMLQDQKRLAISKLEESRSQVSIENKNFEFLKKQLENVVVQNNLKLKSKDTELETKTQELADKSKRVTNLEEKIETQTQELEVERKKLSEAAEGISGLEKKIIDNDKCIAQLNSSLDGLNKELDLSRIRSKENEERLAKENGDLKVENTRLNTLNKKLSYATAAASEGKKSPSHTEFEKEDMVDETSASKKLGRSHNLRKKT